MARKRLVFRVHAIQRMLERGIDVEDVHYVLETGEVIEDYPDDKPYPSRLVLGRQRSRLLHVVAADDPKGDEVIVITVYEPNAAQWESDFRRRRRP